MGRPLPSKVPPTRCDLAASTPLPLEGGGTGRGTAPHPFDGEGRMAAPALRGPEPAAARRQPWPRTQGVGAPTVGGSDTMRYTPSAVV